MRRIRTAPITGTASCGFEFRQTRQEQRNPRILGIGTSEEQGNVHRTRGCEYATGPSSRILLANNESLG